MIAASSRGDSGGRACCVAGAVGGVVRGGDAGAVAALLPTAASAPWQPGDRLAAFCCRQASEAEPPVGTLAQCAW